MQLQIKTTNFYKEKEKLLSYFELSVSLAFLVKY